MSTPQIVSQSLPVEAAGQQCEVQTTETASQWFRDEVHVHDGPLKAYLRGQFPAVHDIDDLVQESYLKIWVRRHTHAIVCTRAFLFMVAKRMAIDVLRRRKTSRVEAMANIAELDVIEDGIDVAHMVARNEEYVLLSQALHSLPHRCQNVMILRKIEGFSHREIAERLGMSEGTVHQHIGKGLRRLAEFFRANTDGK